MGSLGIRARFPLGVYQGRGPDGATRDPLPSPHRLQGALTHAAGKGVTAVETVGGLRPSAQALLALEWLDHHPPDAVEVPGLVPACRGSELASWRAEGVFEDKRGRLVDKKRRADLRNRTALAGAVGWLWDDVPDGVAQTIAALCEDVSCLGEADAPVVLEVADIQPTHRRAARSTTFGRQRGLRFDCPQPGTMAARHQAYESEHPRKRPSEAADRFTKGQLPSPSPAPDVRRIEIFAPLEEPEPAIPWTKALVFASESRLPEELRVRWCVAFHRLLAARMGDSAPSSITGTYPTGQRRPANRVAIQALDASLAGLAGFDSDIFVVLLPRGLSSADAGQLSGALAGRLELRSSVGTTRLRQIADVAADEFWQPPASGRTRLWEPVPAMVSETRRQEDRGSERWTLQHAALLSLAFVFKDDLLPTQGRRDYWALVDAARQVGVGVHSVRRVADSRVERYAHRYPQDAVVQPFTAKFQLGALSGPQTVLAVGQSRHLGGGLLRPVDVVEEIARALT